MAGAGEPGGDGGIVGGGAREDLVGEGAAAVERQVAVGAERGEHGGIVGGVGQDDDIRVVLGGGAEHRRPADIDVLDGGAVVRRGRD